MILLLSLLFLVFVFFTVSATVPPIFAQYSFDAATVNGNKVGDLSNNERAATLLDGASINSTVPLQVGDYLQLTGDRSSQRAELDIGESKIIQCAARLEELS